jgi:hypothetical protein
MGLPCRWREVHSRSDRIRALVEVVDDDDFWNGGRNGEALHEQGFFSCQRRMHLLILNPNNDCPSINERDAAAAKRTADQSQAAAAATRFVAVG